MDEFNFGKPARPQVSLNPKVLMAVGLKAYRPRFESLERLYDRIAGGDFAGGATLHGCQIGPAPRKFAPHDLWVRRERPRKTASSSRKAK